MRYTLTRRWLQSAILRLACVPLDDALEAGLHIGYDFGASYTWQHASTLCIA